MQGNRSAADAHPSAAAQTFSEPWHTVDGGGVMFSGGGPFSPGGSIGQADAGPLMTGGAFALSGGFWVEPPKPPRPADLDGDGSVGQGDLGLLLAAFATCPGKPGFQPAAGALGGDPCVTQSDLGVLLASYEAACDQAMRSLSGRNAVCANDRHDPRVCATRQWVR